MAPAPWIAPDHPPTITLERGLPGERRILPIITALVVMICGGTWGNAELNSEARVGAITPQRIHLSPIGQ